jgi:hypothetical protein
MPYKYFVRKLEELYVLNLQPKIHGKYYELNFAYVPCLHYDLFVKSFTSYFERAMRNNIIMHILG